MKIHSTYLSVILTLFFCYLLSCKKNQPLNKSSRALKLFYAFCEKMEKTYVFSDVDTINWNHRYQRMQKSFNDIDLNNSDDLKRLVTLFNEATIGIKDYHFSIKFNQPILKDSIVYPAFESKKRSKTLTRITDFISTDSFYLDKGFTFVKNNSIVYSGKPFSILTGQIRGGIQYFTCSHFDLENTLSTSPFSETTVAVKQFISSIVDSYSSSKGLIIDLRGNMGGNLEDFALITGLLTRKQYKFGYTKYRIGPGKYDFTPWLNSYVNPYKTGVEFEKPIVVLIDGNSGSLTELVVIALKTKANVTIVGETTFGATGILAPDNIYNSSGFTLDEFLKVDQSSCRFSDLYGKSFEGIGVKPDIEVGLDIQRFNNKMDNQLEKAISLF